MIPDFTVVLGVDKSHLKQLEMVLPTWIRHKPSLIKRPFLVFYDSAITIAQIKPHLFDLNVTYQVWPPTDDIIYYGHENTKWFHPQRIKMLSGFVHAPAMRVRTPYWLKIDLDVVATGNDDWIDPYWFTKFPAIISHPWSYTKPPMQMVMLDNWVRKHQDRLPELKRTSPLNLFPEPGASSLPHKRIISWLSFWRTDFTRVASEMACMIEGEGKLPVPSQDGYLWYLAKRLNQEIVRPNMKKLGWSHQSTLKNIREAVNVSMREHQLETDGIS